MRCNIIPVSNLTDQHLIAERNELRFIPPFLQKRVNNHIPLLQGMPKSYTLNTGHMTFWLDKFKYLEVRYDEITLEMISRGFNPNLDIIFDVTLSKQLGLYKDWCPNEKDFGIIKSRIKEKILLKFKWYRFYGTAITTQWFEEIY
jgi:deoxyribonuclease (pyrimidine dimer)